MAGTGTRLQPIAASRLRRAWRFVRSRRASGQSLPEFALILPILLLLTLVAVDFGRIYLGYINLQNMARIAANYAANNPNAWLLNDSATITKYQNQVKADAAATNCTLSPATPANPTFSDANGDGTAYGLGDRASVAFTCTFKVITPIISNIVGGNVSVSASAVFPVKSALTGAGGGGACTPPVARISAAPTTGTAPLDVTFADASTGGPGTAWTWDFGDGTPTSGAKNPGVHTFTASGTYVVTLTVSNLCASSVTSPGTTISVSVAGPALCTVPDLSHGSPKFSEAQAIWNAAGFTTTVVRGTGNNDFNIKSQSIVAGSSVPCTSTITVNG
jgi:PKD repeat protein